MQRSNAELIALNALGWLAETDLLDSFMTNSGADQDMIRAAASQPEFLGAVVDFVMMNDDWVRGVCDAQGLAYEDILAVRAALPGGDLPHWT